MRFGRAQQVEPIDFRSRVRLFVAKDDAAVIVLELAERDESAPLELAPCGSALAGGCAEPLGVGIDGRGAPLPQDTVRPPSSQVPRRCGIDITFDRLVSQFD